MSAANDLKPGEARAKDTEPTVLASDPTDRVAAVASLDLSVEASPSRDHEGAPSPGAGARRVWSAEEIAVLARPYAEEKDEAPVASRGDPALRRWFAHLGRRSARPTGPPARRACSDGADFVVYSAVAAPAPGHTDRVPLPKVLLDRSMESPTAIVRRPSRARRRVGLRLGVALLSAWLGLLAVALLRPSRQSVEGASSGPTASRSAVAEATPLTSVAIATAPVVPSQDASGGIEQASPAEGTLRASRPAASAHHVPTTASTRRAAAPAASLPSATRGLGLDEVTRY